MKIETLADEITNDLFQNHFGEQATRLEMKQADGQRGERDLGGWNRNAVRQIVLRHLQEQEAKQS